MTPDDIIAGLRLIEHRTATNATSAKQIVMPSSDECQIVHGARLLIERLQEQLSGSVRIVRGGTLKPRQIPLDEESEADHAD